MYVVCSRNVPLGVFATMEAGITSVAECYGQENCKIVHRTDKSVTLFVNGTEWNVTRAAVGELKDPFSSSW